MKKKVSDLTLYQIGLIVGTFSSLAFGLVFGLFTIFAKIHEIDSSKPLKFFFIMAVLFVIFKLSLYKELNLTNKK